MSLQKRIIVTLLAIGILVLMPKYDVTTRVSNHSDDSEGYMDSNSMAATLPSSTSMAVTDALLKATTTQNVTMQ